MNRGILSVHHYRRLPNNRSPAPRAHPSRDGNLRRALTTLHLHPPSHRCTVWNHTRHEPPRIIAAGPPSQATTPSGPSPSPTRPPTRQSAPSEAWLRRKTTGDTHQGLTPKCRDTPRLAPPTIVRPEAYGDAAAKAMRLLVNADIELARLTRTRGWTSK
jgi:hypothetical protein